MTMWLKELSGGRLDGSVSAYVISWGGLLFDLSIVPALLWSKTRMVALIAAACFHVFNAMLFKIRVFPWQCIVD
jgi:hypothetical protein